MGVCLKQVFFVMGSICVGAGFSMINKEFLTFELWRTFRVTDLFYRCAELAYILDILAT
jgi:hypothetical protein